MNIGKGQILIKQHWEAWMNIENPDVTVDEAVAKLKELGNDIIEIDYENRRVKVLNEVSE